jgi:hypothetical protein
MRRGTLKGVVKAFLAHRAAGPNRPRARIAPVYFFTGPYQKDPRKTKDSKINVEENMKTNLTSCILVIVLLLAASSAFAGTLAVGPQHCQPGSVHFSTIQAAVTAAPVSGTTTIVVCPGIYPEQVQIIGKQIILKGISYGGSDSAIIEPPAGGLVANANSTFGGPAIEAMVLVQNTTATIEDLTVDGTGNDTVCGQDPIGIFYQNANGTITRDNVLHVQVVGAFGCQGGLGIYVESGATSGPPNPSIEANSTVSITYNNVQDYDKNGITANGTLTGPTSNVGVTISHNTVIGAGAVNDNAQNGIQLYGANGSITSNVIDGDWYTVPGTAATGILIFQSTAPFVESNTISNTNVGIYVISINPDDTDNATIKSNTITATHEYDGIVLCANLSTATGNMINVADESGINVTWCGDAAPTDTVTTNTINGACAGILVQPPASATTSPDTYYNVTTPVLSSSSDSCTTPLFRKQSGSEHRRALVSPARRKLSQ